MLTYTTQLSTYQDWTDNSAANAVNGPNWLNDSVRTICNLQGGKLRFLEATKDVFTVADQAGYQVPAKFRKLIDLSVYSGTGSDSDTIYTPEMVFDPTKWTAIKQARYGSSSTPYFTYVENQKVLIEPIPSVTGNLIHMRGRLNVPDMTIADYATGTITSIANDATTLTASGSTFTADMVGRFINIPQTTAAGGGDGLWYEIGSYTSATVVELLKPYNGTTIAAGSAAYTIGQVSPIPEAYQMAIVYRACALYWEDKTDGDKAKRFWLRYDGGNEAGYNKDYGGLISQMLANEGETEEGAYIPPFGSTANLQQAPYYFSEQQASGLT
jgi:hypothetical protein